MISEAAGAGVIRQDVQEAIEREVCYRLGVDSQHIVDTRCSQHIVDMSVSCIQHIVDNGHTHLNLGGELCPAPLDRITKMPNVAAWR